MYLEHFATESSQAQNAVDDDWSISETFQRGYRPIVIKTKRDNSDPTNFPKGRLLAEGQAGALMPLLQTEMAADAKAFFTRSKILVETNAIKWLATWAEGNGGAAAIRRLEVAVAANVEKESNWQHRFVWIAPFFLFQIVDNGARLEVRSKLKLRDKYRDWLEYDCSGAVYDAQKSQDKTKFDGNDIINAVRRLEECRLTKRMDPTHLWRCQISDSDFTILPGDRRPFVNSMKRAIEPMGKTDQYDHLVCSYAFNVPVEEPDHGDFHFEGYWWKWFP